MTLDKGIICAKLQAALYGAEDYLRDPECQEKIISSEIPVLNFYLAMGPISKSDCEQYADTINELCSLLALL